MKTSELSGRLLDWAVAICEGWTYSHDFKYGDMYFPPKLYEGVVTHWEERPPIYSSSWAQGGPIIEREKIQIGYFPDGWRAQNWQGKHNTQCGHTPLIAAMRCYVASKFGDEIEVPKELQQ